MTIPPFKLERYFAAWEFVSPYLLCSSDIEGWALADLLALADDDARARWDGLTLGYTEYPGLPALREAIAELYTQVAPDEILTFAGASEAIFAFMQTTVAPGDHVITWWPGYQSLAEVARARGADVTLLPLRHDEGWALDLDALRRALRPTTRLIILNTPHNPTGALLDRLGIPAPAHGSASSWEEARAAAAQIGYPVVVRPSYVLGGRAMAIVYDESSLERYMREAVDASPEHPVLIDRFLEDAFEMDVDAVCDGETVAIAGIMEQIELAGVHSGDSACVIPTYMVAPEHVETMRRHTEHMARELGVIGLMNVQYAMKDGLVYVLEVNPRASRTIPFVAKATGVPWAQIAVKAVAGANLADLISHIPADHPAVGHEIYHVKEVVLPWARFQGVDTLLGPEMKSTGEAMGSGASFGEAFAKAQLGCGQNLPLDGNAFISVNDRDKENLVPIARDLAALGFTLLATGGTAAFLRAAGLAVTPIYKVNEGRPNAVDYVKNGQIALIVNTPLGKASFFDEVSIRRAAIHYGIPSLTTLSGAAAAVQAIRALRDDVWTVESLQERAAARS